MEQLSKGISVPAEFNSPSPYSHEIPQSPDGQVGGSLRSRNGAPTCGHPQPRQPLGTVLNRNESYISLVLIITTQLV